MSNTCARLCSLIVGEFFVEDIVTVVDHLLYKGDSPLTAIARGTRLPLAAVQSALKILIQHFLVECDTTLRPRRSELLYFARQDNILELTRYPRYLIHTKNETGPVSREVLEEIAKCGQVSTSKLIFICGSRVLVSNPGVTEEVLNQQLRLFQSTILTLAERKYICIAEPRIEEEVVVEGSNEKNLFTVPDIDLKLILSKLQVQAQVQLQAQAQVQAQVAQDSKGKKKPGKKKKTSTSTTLTEKMDTSTEKMDTSTVKLDTSTEKMDTSTTIKLDTSTTIKLDSSTSIVNLDELPDADILWRIHFDQFHAEIRNCRVFEALERKFKMTVDPKVLKTLIDHGLEKHPWENEGHPISFAELKDHVAKMTDGEKIAENIAEHIEIVEDDPCRFITKLSNHQGGHYSFNMKTTVLELFWNTVDRVISERHGFYALRIFRLVKDNGFIEQEEINEMGMVPGKLAKNLTYKLLEEHFLAVKEVRKSYAANAPPSKAVHVFYVDPATLVRRLQLTCYQSMINLKLRIRTETAKIKMLMQKEERITRILVNMTKKKNSTEEQLKEIRELLTPPERALIRRFKVQVMRLYAGVNATDETLFVTELFMRYVRKAKPTK